MNQEKPQTSQLVFLGVAGCFLLSGFAALLYQLSWMRQFSTVFGTSEIAIATVLSAYMGGLALGSAVSAKLIKLIKKPILFYGVLEASIAVSALLVPVLLLIAKSLYVSMLGGQSALPDASGIGQPLFYFLVAFVVLLVPTACMGATLPVLTRYVVKQDSQITNRVGFLYAINTVGAVAGVLVAGFLLLPNLGLRGTVWVGVAINFLVFLIATAIAKMASKNALATKQNQQIDVSGGIDKTDEQTAFSGWLILPIMTFSGVATFVYEVLWTRLLSHILGGSVSAFAIMLASFLSGIAIGSFVASRFAQTRKQACLYFVFCQLAITLSSIVIYYSLENYLPTSLSPQENFAGIGFLAFAILMPATLFIGATFPLAVRIYALNAESAARSSAQVYAWNTLGAIMGAAIAGFFLVPVLKYEGTILAMVLLNASLAAVVALFLVKKNWLPVLTSFVVLALLALFYRPLMPETMLRASPIAPATQGEILYYDVGRSSTVFLYTDNGSFSLRNNGLPEAAVLPKGAPNLLSNQRLLGALPVLARPDAKSALIVGLGGGAAVSGVPPTVESIDVIELESKVITANQLISDKRKYSPLKDERVSIVINDAHSALALSNKKYDIVVSQPSHPWTAGASHLYTREYMQLVSDHLTEDGVFLQWINSQFLDENLLKSLSATIADVYPYVRVYQWTPEVLFFLAAPKPLDVEQNIIASNRPFIDAPTFYLELGVATPEDAVAALMMEDDAVREFSKGSTIITDNFNRMAMQSSRVLRTGNKLNSDKLNALLEPWVPVLNANSWLHTNAGGDLNFSRIDNKYTLLRAGNFKRRLIKALENTNNANALLISGEDLLRRGENTKAQELFAAAATFMPDSNEAKYALIKSQLRTLNTSNETAQSQVSEVISSMSGPARGVAEAIIAFSSGDIQSVADLDQQLSQALPGQSWFTAAVKLRVDWRNSVSNPELQQQFSDQAWQILDLAMANEFDHDFYAMRIFSAAQAQRETEVIESTRHYVSSLELQITAIEEGIITPSKQELDLKANQVEVISRLFNDAQQQNDEPDSDIQSIMEDLNDLHRRFQSAMDSTG